MHRKQQLCGFLPELHPSLTLKELCYEVVWAYQQQWCRQAQKPCCVWQENCFSQSWNWRMNKQSAQIKQNLLLDKSARLSTLMKWGGRTSGSQWPLGREAERNCEEILLENVPWLKLSGPGGRRTDRSKGHGTVRNGAVLISPHAAAAFKKTTGDSL